MGSPLSKNSAYLSVVVPKEVKAKLAELAKDDRRSLSQMVSIILEDFANGKNVSR
ncbi:ribbon-helix-helix domain-containing protein [Cerasicoccus fimbriatus]|uniref:ribbon-helix-helix domain-containing protein n=1 Tax=Cerasicoccus fimbriatus TaxID=3014554 RepID=UPI003CCDA225